MNKTDFKYLSANKIPRKMFKMLVLRCFLDIQILMFSMSLDLEETKARNNYLINGEQMDFKDQL